MALTPHQDEIKEKGLSILMEEGRLLVKGSAGVGKTYMMNEFIKEYNRRLGGNVVCAAPTNKAVAVLKSKVDNDLCEFSTLASLLKIRRKVNPKNGDVTFEPVYNQRNRPLEDIDIIFLDEASMTSEMNHIWLEEHADIMGTKIVYIGDSKQLPPVKEVGSTVFWGKPKLYALDNIPTLEGGETVRPRAEEGTVMVYTPYPQVELTEIIRQGNGNPIVDLSRNLSRIKSMDNSLIESEEGKIGYMYTLDRNKVVDTLATVNGSDKLKYLGYTNAEVDRMNRDVRNLIYGSPRKVEAGESLVFNSPYKDMYYNNEEIKVETVEDVWQKFSVVKATGIDEHEFRVYVINGKKVDDRWYGVFVIHEHSEKHLRTLAHKMKKEAGNREMSYADRDAFLNQFADVKYNHALTVHKSQGSTFQQVIVNVTNLMTNRDEKERNCLLYTAVTRASELLILYF